MSTVREKMAMRIGILLCTLATLCSGFQFDRAYSTSKSSQARLYLGGMSDARHKPEMRKRASQNALTTGVNINAIGFLKIDGPPVKSLEAREHGRIVLECSSTGNPTSQISWYKDGQLLYKEHGTSVNDAPEAFPMGAMSEVRSRYMIECAAEEDAGFYECVAENSARKTSVGTEVTVVKYDAQACRASPEIAKMRKPLISQHMTTLLQAQNTDAHVICRSEDPHITTWFGPSGKKINIDNKYKVLPSGDLLIKNIGFDDMGVYKCRIDNDFGDDDADTFVYPHAGY